MYTEAKDPFYGLFLKHANIFSPYFLEKSYLEFKNA